MREQSCTMGSSWAFFVACLVVVQSYLTGKGWIGTWLGSSPEHIDRLLVAPQTAKE